MPSILARFRRRTLSHQSTASAELPPSPPLVLPPTATLSPSRSEPMLVDRRIVEDLPALLGALEQFHPPRSAALSPPRPRKRSGLSTLGLGPKARSPPEHEPRTASEKENEEFMSATAPAAPSAWKGKQRAARLSQQISTGSPWSTFGRHRKRPSRSPYGSPHPPSARSSRMASVDSRAFRSSSMSKERQTVSNLASSASIDRNSNSRPTDSSQDVSMLSTLAGSLSNRSVQSHHSAAVTFGVHSPANYATALSPLQPEADTVAHTSMPVLPLTYSTENVPSRTNTFPRRQKKAKTRSRSAQRNIPRHFTTTDDDFHERNMHDIVVDSLLERGGDERQFLDAGGGRERPGVAEPHALRVSPPASGCERPCSPHFIPPSLSLSSPTPLDAEDYRAGATSDLSHSSPYTNPLEREEESLEGSWMADAHNGASTLTRKASDTRDAPRRASRTGTSSRSRSKRASQLSEQSTFIDARDAPRRELSTSSLTGTPSRSRSKRLSQLSEQSTPIASTSSSNHNGGAGPSSAAFPLISTPPPPAPQRIPRTPRTASEPGLRSVSEKSGLETPVKGKRKAEDVDLTPPDQRTGHHATFVIPADGRRSQRVSEVSGAPSSYNGRKRARIQSSSFPSDTPPRSRPASSQSRRPASVQRHPTDSWPNRSHIPNALQRITSKTSNRSARPESTSAPQRHHHLTPAERRRSMSEISFPISALVAPHAPSVSIRSGGYYMRDPRKPPRVQPTPWTLSLGSTDEQGSPIHAWMFFIGFVLFPLWWVASFWRIPQTRRVGGTDTEKAVTLDDPQVEHDATSWRLRCRVMSVVSLFTYIPFIVLVAIFVPRS